MIKIIWGLEKLIHRVLWFGAQVDRPPMLTRQTRRILIYVGTSVYQHDGSENISVF